MRRGRVRQGGPSATIATLSLHRSWRYRLAAEATSLNVTSSRGTGRGPAVRRIEVTKGRPILRDGASRLLGTRADRGPPLPQAPQIFDRKLIAARRERARKLGPATFLIDRVADDMAERLGAVLRTFERAADVGTPTDAVRRALAGKVGEIAEVIADEEALPFARGSLDLVVSALALQFVNDLPGMLVQICRALKPDGLFLAALIGGESLTELRQAFAAAEAEVEGGVSPRVAPFADLRELGALLQRAGFALPVTDVDRVTVRYASPIELMHDLRRMGASNAMTERRRVPLKRATLKRMT